ncbi:histidine kinase [Hymenobacter sp. BT683]|uniref:Histidine kinase n=1 Tax=Hymenobacter jeongseonensis TaxID=2791027 RepID=A0ABS0IMN9_9BACT|nr:histidine kinase [Hymenobacter jeongseonensis]
MLGPQFGAVLLFYGWYLYCRFLLASESARHRRKTQLRHAGTGLQLVVAACSLALGVNVATYYAQPAYFNYDGFGLLAWLGYNDAPLTNWLTGLDRALVLTAVLAAYLMGREHVIRHLERPGATAVYRVLVSNQITAAVVPFLLLPLVLHTLQLVDNDLFYLLYFSLLPAAALTYFSLTYWLLPTYWQQPRITFAFVARLLLSTALYSFPFAVFFQQTGPFGPVWLGSWAVQLLLVTPTAWVRYVQHKDKIRQLLGLKQALVQSTATLQALRAQINPHFLFNVLNALYGSALARGAQETAVGIQQLGDMMRFMLHDNHQDFIPLRRETDYLQNYLALQQLRVQAAAHVTIEADIADDATDRYRITPMVLIPFVENAFKHGLSGTEKSWIRVRFRCDAERIHFQVRNSVHAQAAPDPDTGASGVGLPNVAERLRLVYGDRHGLAYGSSHGEFTVDLWINHALN